MSLHTTRSARRGFKREILRLTNEARREHGVAPVKLTRSLNVSAMAKSRDMAKYNYFSHDTPKSSWYRFLYKYAGDNWRTIGENIAMGQDTARIVFTAWMNSPEHRHNILDAKYKLMGVGFARRGDIEFWTQHFGTVG